MIPAALPVEAVLERLAARAPVAVQYLPPAAALGRVLAEPLRATAAQPARAIALRAGFAVCSRALLGASPYLPLRPALAEPVEIGDALPDGTDAVLPGEALESGEASTEVAPGDGVRRAGEDAPAGALLRGAGEIVRPVDVALAAALEIDAVAVRVPRVAIAGAGAAQFLAHCCEQAGATVERTEVPTSDTADLLIAVAPSEGERAALARLMGDGLVARWIALRPAGESMLAGALGARAVLVVPDRIEAALAAFLALVEPLLRRLAGAATGAGTVEGMLTRKLASRIGLTELALLSVADDQLEPLGIGDLTLASIARADAWLLVPPESEGFPAGARVEARRLR